MKLRQHEGRHHCDASAQQAHHNSNPREIGLSQFLVQHFLLFLTLGYTYLLPLLAKFASRKNIFTWKYLNYNFFFVAEKCCCIGTFSYKIWHWKIEIRKSFLVCLVIHPIGKFEPTETAILLLIQRMSVLRGSLNNLRIGATVDIVPIIWK